MSMYAYYVACDVLSLRAVTVSSPSEFLRIGKQRKQQDNRRNLYVLGLPFDLSK